jgi:hypothetical protein
MRDGLPDRPSAAISLESKALRPGYLRLDAFTFAERSNALPSGANCAFTTSLLFSKWIS